ncbi:hypothetical protein [Hyphomonas adhaerens]|uniref:hypothetical protein n=1 Tax=Hyphomonas adhaerens TaxID=81029 RepID=UPI0023534A0D|nr:hypothetical protein [Hyphomonas adhaerens]
MRYAGLCSILLLIPAACDDAAGSAYSDDSSPVAIEGADPETPSPEDSRSEAVTDAAGTADVSASGAAEGLEARAASLGLTQEMDFTCVSEGGNDGSSAHVVLYGNEELAAVLIPRKVNVPLYLDCSPTRIGPECSDGVFTALINTLEEKARFDGLDDAAPLTCTLVQPGRPPDVE